MSVSLRWRETEPPVNRPAGRPTLRETSPGALPFLDVLKKFGADSLSFTAVESGMRHWVDEETDACVAYVDTGSAWVAVGAPVGPPQAVVRVARRFALAARASGRRACFFATETLKAPDFSSLVIGEQPIFRPAEWLRERRGSLRGQIRRARAKGVHVRRVEPAELDEGSHLRSRIEQLTAEWLASRHMEPMGFAAAVEPFHHPEEHRYFVAERRGEVIEFLSAVPIYARDGWLVEDVIRGESVPNGTTELLLDAFARDVASSRMLTLGLSPLTGNVVWPLRLARVAMRPLFDFTGLRAFRERLHPESWEPVFLVYPKSESWIVHVVEALRAMARGSLIRFGARSLVRHPSGPPWLLSLPLVPWCAALACLALTHRAPWLGFSASQLAAWVVFDIALALALFRAALRPRLTSLVPVTALAALDAALSLEHAVRVGFGATWVDASLRLTAVVAPCCGALVLGWACLRATKSSSGKAATPRIERAKS